MEQTLDILDSPAQDRNYAGFGLRLVAYIIDTVVVSIALSIIIVPLSLGLGLFSNSKNMDDPTVTFAILSAIGGICLLGTIGVCLYFALMESGKNQASLGKMAMGIVVTDINGHPVTFWRALGRTLGKILSGMTLYIGYIMILFTDKQQGLHDMIANCLVLKKTAE